MVRKAPHAAPIFMAGFMTVTVLGLAHVLTLFWPPTMRARFGGLIPFAHGANWIVLLGTGWYTLGRFFAAMPYLHPGARRACSRITVLRYLFNFLVVSVGLTPAGLVFGLAIIWGAARSAWEVPVLIVGLICAHVAWIWADRHGDRILRAAWPRLSWPEPAGGE